MEDLLETTIKAHGGLERWNGVRSVTVSFNYYGALLDLKGYPGHRKPTVWIDATTPRAVIQHLEPGDDRWIFAPGRVWIERPDGFIVEERFEPRSAFAGHDRATPWDRLHLTYFLGYAMWNYLTTPFLFTWPGFTTREVEGHVENRQTWRVLEVTYPDTVPAHTSRQRLYFDEAGMLKRLDYVTDVLGGVGAHYCYDPKTFDGIVMPTLRRVVRRTPDGVNLSGPTSFVLDYTDVSIHRS